eukprot:gene21386-27416_t
MVSTSSDAASDSDGTLLRLAYCDYLAHSLATDGVTECYSEIVDRLASMLVSSGDMEAALPQQFPSFSLASSPLACERHRLHHHLFSSEEDAESMQLLRLKCHLLAARYRMALYALVQLVDPITAIPITEGAHAPHELKSLRVVSQCLLGLPQCGELTTPRHHRICSSVLAYAKQHASSEAVYLMFYKMCTTASSASPDRLSDGRFLVTSLLTVGAVEVAAKYTAHLFEDLCALPTEPLESPSSHASTASSLAEAVPGLRQLFAQQESSLGSNSDLLKSSSIRAALTLFDIFHRLQLSEDSLARLVRDDELLSLFLSTLLQVCSPVILELPSGVENALRVDWITEVVLLRSVVVVVLDALVARCSPSLDVDDLSPRCALIAPHSSVGGRGLFLLAYQGAALISSMGGEALSPTLKDLLTDWRVPSRYHELVTLTNPHIHWQYSRQQISGNLTNTEALNNTRKPRIAFLSFFFTRHSVGRLLARIVAQIDIDKFDVILVTKQASPSAAAAAAAARDDVSEYFHSVFSADRWLYLPLSINQAVDILRSASIDVLVFSDVFMDSFVTHLAMTRSAPVQLSFWGHPFTSGYFGSMDYFVTSQGFEPPEGRDSRQEQQFSEQLVRFDSLSFQMFPAEEKVGDTVQNKATQSPTTVQRVWSELSSEGDSLCLGQSSSFRSSRLSYLQWVLSVARDIRNMPVNIRDLVIRLASLGAEDGSTSDQTTLCALLSRVRVYGALQSLMKMHPLFDAALLDILRSDPSALILLSRSPKQTVWQRRLSERLLALDSSLRVDSNTSTHSVLSRVLFVDQMPHTQYARLLCGVDVSLDPFPFGGGVTLCDAVSGGCDWSVPFVTSGALQSVHRIGSGLADVFNDSSVAHSSTSSNLINGCANEITEYSLSAVEMAKSSLVSKLNPIGAVHSANVTHIQYSVYQDDRAAKEWNLFFARLTQV